MSAAESAEGFYDGKYTERLIQAGSTIRLRRTFLFEPYLTKTDRVLDFGCGPGDLLETLTCNEKFGVEISEASREMARQKGIKVFSSLQELTGETFNKIISAHALEHVVDPAEKLMQLRELLADDGLLILVLPMNEWVNWQQRKWRADDRNKHLYTWTPLLIGNLLFACGFEPVMIKAIHHFHPPKIGNFLARTSRAVYHMAAAAVSRVMRQRQVLAVARVRRSANTSS